MQLRQRLQTKLIRFYSLQTTCLLWGWGSVRRGFHNFPLSCKMRLRATLPPLSPDLIIFLVILIMTDKTMIRRIQTMIRRIQTMIRRMGGTVRSTWASCCSPPSPTQPWSMNTKPWKFKLNWWLSTLPLEWDFPWLSCRPLRYSQGTTWNISEQVGCILDY